jgi:hypothetical protein
MLKRMIRGKISFLLAFLFGIGLVFMPSVAFSQVSDLDASTLDTSTVISNLSQEEEMVAQVYLDAIEAQGASGISVTKVAIVDNYALLEWSERDGGGVCLLFKEPTGWRIVRGTGGTFSHSMLVQVFGVPAEVAEQLLNQISPGWQNSIDVEEEGEL